jgi:cytochrome c oxidase subunit II
MSAAVVRWLTPGARCPRDRVGARSVRPRLLTILVACALLAAGCRGDQSTLEPESRPAREITTLWWWMLLIACIVFAGALGMLGLAWLRRRREGMPLLKGGSTRDMALVVAFGIVIPIVVNVGVFIVANFFVIKQTEAPAATTTRMTIQVVGRQFFWEVRYPGTRAVTANEIHIPVHTRVNVVATTGDVIHSFWVPRLNRKIDMIPGRRNRVLLEADTPGRYRGQCAEFCGIEHARMSMYVFAQTPAAFRAWLRNQATGARAPATARQRAGRTAFFRDQCASCHALRGTAASGQIGPDLTHLGSRDTIAALALPNKMQALELWLRDPQHAKPGNRMPDLGLSGPDVRNLAAYLESLR